MGINVIRNNQWYGPYDEQTLLEYVNDGKLLKQDIAIEDGGTVRQTVGYYLNRCGMKPRIANKGNIFSQIGAIGSELIFPRKEIFTKEFMSDQRLFILLLVGLLPMVIFNIPLGGFFRFYEVSLYFSMIWGLFFYACFKTSQVKLKTTVGLFFLAQLIVFTLFEVLSLPSKINPFYAFVSMPFPLSIIGFVFGVGVSEEVVKLLPLLFLLKRAKEPLSPQTMVYYGLMSGIAFGVYEGVQYQMTVNAMETYDVSFFLNIARLTGLPFLHACWCGIAGYFLCFASLYPKYRLGLYTLAIAVPALLHGLYDSFSSFWIVNILVASMGLLLLVMYLKKSVNYQSKLRQ